MHLGRLTWVYYNSWGKYKIKATLTILPSSVIPWFSILNLYIILTRILLLLFSQTNNRISPTLRLHSWRLRPRPIFSLRVLLLHMICLRNPFLIIRIKSPKHGNRLARCEPLRFNGLLLIGAICECFQSIIYLLGKFFLSFLVS